MVKTNITAKVEYYDEINNSPASGEGAGGGVSVTPKTPALGTPNTLGLAAPNTLGVVDSPPLLLLSRRCGGGDSISLRNLGWSGVNGAG